jgi:V/A-type H+/Na+-transporting ATPase subunit D
MSEALRQVSPSRVALLELKDERRLVEEGFELLDEKRVLIAARIRRELERHRRLAREFEARHGRIRARFASAIASHGLDELDCMPGASCETSRLELVPDRFLDIELLEVDVAAGAFALEHEPLVPAPLVHDLAHLEHQAIECAARLAASEVSLRRLLHEYVRTERRARALENILMPEIRGTQRFVEEQLDGLDQEEAVRVRRGRSALGSQIASVAAPGRSRTGAGGSAETAA